MSVTLNITPCNPPGRMVSNHVTRAMVVRQPFGSELDPTRPRSHGLLGKKLEAQDIPEELLGTLLIGHRHGNDLEGFDGHSESPDGTREE